MTESKAASEGEGASTGCGDVFVPEQVAAGGTTSLRSRIKRACKGVLLRFRVGRWILVFFEEIYLDEYARVSRAADGFFLRHGAEAKHLRFRICRVTHRLEKGLAMAQRRRGFGRTVAEELMELLRLANRTGLGGDELVQWAQAVGCQYRAVLKADLDSGEVAAAHVDRLVALEAELGGLLREMGASTGSPCSAPSPDTMPRLPENALGAFQSLLAARQSVRRWTEDPVPPEVVHRAVEQALLAPSACNRQPFSVVCVADRDQVAQVAGLLLGGSGFADKAPLLVAALSDFAAYEGHTHRKVALTDGAMAAMTFLLSLTAQGYSSVCMNWSVSVARDRKMRGLLGIDDSQVILFFIAIGRRHPDALVPHSARKRAERAIRWA